MFLLSSLSAGEDRYRYDFTDRELDNVKSKNKRSSSSSQGWMPVEAGPVDFRAPSLWSLGKASESFRQQAVERKSLLMS